MDTEQDSGKVSREAARRYAEWLKMEMTRQGLNNSKLAERSGVKKQTISAITSGRALQPTAWQIARIATALGFDPNLLFERMGLWSGEAGPPDLQPVWNALGYPERHALRRMGEVLIGLQEELAGLSRREPQRVVFERDGKMVVGRFVDEEDVERLKEYERLHQQAREQEERELNLPTDLDRRSADDDGSTPPPSDPGKP